MDSVCAEQHKHQLLLSKKALREVDIPPRKLLARRATSAPEGVVDMFADSPGAAAEEEALLRKFLPFNGGNEDEDDDDPYSSDHFRMYEFKVRRCTRSRSHDWTDCPFAHPGEKARRRDPRRYHYSGGVCAEFRRGNCSRGDNCEFAHGVFECWLHPARYRTEACKDGKNCKRKVCFFAHSPRQLRLLPPSSQPHCNSPPPPPAERKHRNSNHCCLFCHSAASPTSTLMVTSHLSPPMSPSLSPPVSPAKSRSMSGLSPISRYSDRWASADSCGLSHFNPDSLTYKDVLTELMTSLESMNVNQASPPSNTNRRNPQWVDVSFNNGDDQQQFVLSPSPPTPSPSGSRKFQTPGEFSGKSLKIDDNKLIDSNLGCPDIGWVNDLLT